MVEGLELKTVLLGFLQRSLCYLFFLLFLNFLIILCLFFFLCISICLIIICIHLLLLITFDHRRLELIILLPFGFYLFFLLSLDIDFYLLGLRCFLLLLWRFLFRLLLGFFLLH